MLKREMEMFSLRSVAVSLLCLAWWASSSQAQDLSRYREFRLGTTLSAVALQADVPTIGVRLIHSRPSLIQELGWQPRPAARPASEAVRNVRFTFCDSLLYQITVDYDRDRIEGLTAGDFVDALSVSYGVPILASTRIGSGPPPADDDLSQGVDRTVVAQWEDPQYLVSLVHTSYPSAFGLVLLARLPEQLARVATAASTRLDALEAPQREVNRQQKQADEDRAKAEKARLVNKAAFRF
jgi:hypothetical protein